MLNIRLSGLAVLAGMALVFATSSCANPSSSVPWSTSGNCSPPCGPNMVCTANGQCVPGSWGNNNGSTSNSGTGGTSSVGTANNGGGTNNGGSGNSSSQGSGGAQTGTGTGGSGGGVGGGSSSGSGGGTSSGGTNYCGSCSTNADCGGGNNFCLGFSFGNYCGTDCSSGQSCPSGATCQQIGDGSGNVVGSNCVPNGTDCSGNPTGGSGSGGSGSGGSGSGGSSGGSSGGGASCTTDTWSNYGSSFFNQYCANCHGNMGSQSGVQSQLSTIASSIQSGRMPPGGLSSSQEQRVIQYLNCGAP